MNVKGEIKTSSRRLRQVRSAFNKSVRFELEETAKVARFELASQIHAGRMVINKEKESDKNANLQNRTRSGLNTDSGALAASFYIVSVRGGGEMYYNAALGRARNYYLSKDEYGASDYHFENRVLPRIKGGKIGGYYIAGAASVLKYAAWWNKGHKNQFTGRFERVPFIDSARYNVHIELAARMRFLAERFSGTKGAYRKNLLEY